MVYRLRLKDFGEKRQNLIIVPLTEEGFAKGGTIGEVIALNEKKLSYKILWDSFKIIFV